MAKAMRSKDSTRRFLGARAAALAALLALSVTLGLHPAPAAFGEEEPPAPPAQPAAVETDAAPASSSLANLVAAVFQVADAAKAIAPEPPALATGLTGAGEAPAAASPTDGGTGASQVDPDGQALGGDAGMGGSAPQMLAVHEAQARFTLAHALDSDRAIPVVSADFLLQPPASGDQPAEDAPDGSAAMPVPAALAASLVQDGCAYAIEPDGASVALVAANPSAQGRFALPASVEGPDGTAYSLTRIAAGACAALDAETLAIPASVVTIDEGAFAGNGKLQRLEVAEGSVAYAAFDGCLYDADGAELLLVPEARAGEVRIAATATRVAPAVFDQATAVDAIAVEEGGSAFSASNGALYDADGLTLLRAPAAMADLVIADGCARVEAGALKDCAALRTIHSPASVAFVSPRVFDGEVQVTFAEEGAAGEGEDAVEGAEDGGATVSSLLAGDAANEGSASSAPQVFALSALVGVDKGVEQPDADVAKVLVPEESAGDAWARAGFEVSLAREGADPIASHEAEESEADLPVVEEDSLGERDAARARRILYFYKEGGSLYAPAGAEVNSDTATCLSIWNMNNNDLNSWTVTMPTGSKTGYTLQGFATSSGGSVKYSPGQFTSSLKDVALYAVWAEAPKPTYTVTFNANGGSVSPSSKTVTSGSSTTAPTPTRSGYTFDGWYTAASGGTYVCRGGGSTGAITSNKTLYAHWIKNITYYTVTWNANGGSVSPSSSTVASGSSVTAPTPTKTGYTFDGWYTASSGGTRVCGGGGSTGSITSSRTYYAHWTAKTYAVSFNANGGSGGQSGTKTATYGSAMPAISTTAPTRTGYTFGGWYDTSASTGGTQYYTAAGASARTWDKASNTTLYARWTIKTYTVTFDKKGGTGGTSIKQVAYGSTVGTVTNPTLSGWTFRGYTDDFSASPYQFAKADGTATTRTITDARTLYANWTKTVSLNANGGTAGSLTSITAGIGRPLGQKCNQVASGNVDYPIRSLFSKGITDSSTWKPTRTGYTFAGYWSTSASSGGTQWVTAEGTGSTVTSSIPSTLYARWTANKYTVSFSANGGSGGQSSSVTATYGSAMPTISTTKPTKTGYTFAGWYDIGSSSGGTQYYTSAGASARTWNRAANTVLYARWTPNKYDVTFNANGGSGGQSAKVSATYGSAMPTISTTKPTKTGYAFGGWYDTSSSSGGTQYYTAAGASARTWNKVANTTLYARWTPNTYTVSFNANGGSGGQSSDVTATYGSAMPTISATPPTKTYQDFLGWYDTSASTGGTQYYDADGKSVRSWDKAQNAILYARWTRHMIDLTFHNMGATNGISAKTIPEGTSPAPIDDLPSIEGWDFRGYGRNLNNAVNFTIYTTSEGKGTGSGLTRRTTDLYAIFTRTVEFEGSGATSAGKLESMGVCIGREFGLKYHMNTSLQWYVELNDILGKGLAETIKDPNWAPARNGYTFDGYWTAKESGIGTQYISKDGLAVHEVTKDTPGKLYAQWRAIAYALTYNTNGGTLTGQKATYTIEDDDYVLPTPTRTGYSFAGWFDNEALTGSPVTRIPKGSMGDKELWAKWELATYRLAYDVAHGTHANRTGDFTLADLPIAIGAATPDEGYSFGGWTGPGLDEPAREFSLTEAFLEGKPGGTTLTFAASVTPNRYELTLHANDGTDAVVAHEVVYDAAVPQAQVPRRYGYAFNGYYLKCDDGSKGERYFDAEGTYVRDEGLWKGLAGEHLYAGWTLVADLDVPVVDPGEVTFQVEMASGNVEVVGENSGCVRSFMPQAVPLASVALETVADEAGTPVVEQWLGPDSAEFTAMEVALGADGAAAKPVLRFAAGGALGEAVAPVIPAATGDGAAGSVAGSPGELPVSYLLKRLDGFELPLPEPNYTPGAVGYVRFAVDLSGLVAEQF